jgi:hypothetical protein
MAYDEHTIQLLIGHGKYKDFAEFMVQIDEDEKVVAVYTDKGNYDDLPVPLKRLTWTVGKNPLYIHVQEVSEAGSYIRRRGIDTEAE